PCPATWPPTGADTPTCFPMSGSPVPDPAATHGNIAGTTETRRLDAHPGRDHRRRAGGPAAVPPAAPAGDRFGGPGEPRPRLRGAPAARRGPGTGHGRRPARERRGGAAGP